MCDAVRLPISIVIPTKNEAVLLPRLLSSIAAQSPGPSEVIVADGGSVDGTVAVAGKFGARVVEGGNSAKGRNSGMRASSQETIVFIDADVMLPSPGSLKRIYDAFCYMRVDTASCMFRGDGVDSTASSKVFFAATNFARRFCDLPLIRRTAYRTNAWGTTMVVRKNVVTAVGGFDERLSHWVDGELITSVVNAGYTFGLIREYVITSERRYRKIGIAILFTSTIVSIALGWARLVYGSDTERYRTAKERLIRLYGRHYGELGGEPVKR